MFHICWICSDNLLVFCIVYQRITDADLRALVSDEVFQAEPIWKLDDLQVS